MLANFFATFVFEHLSHDSILSLVISLTLLLSPPNISESSSTLLAIIQSHFLLLSLSLALLIRLFVSAAKPITNFGLSFFLLEIYANISGFNAKFILGIFSLFF